MIYMNEYTIIQVSSITKDTKTNEIIFTGDTPVKYQVESPEQLEKIFDLLIRFVSGESRNGTSIVINKKDLDLARGILEW